MVFPETRKRLIGGEERKLRWRVDHGGIWCHWAALWVRQWLQCQHFQGFSPPRLFSIDFSHLIHVFVLGFMDFVCRSFGRADLGYGDVYCEKGSHWVAGEACKPCPFQSQGSSGSVISLNVCFILIFILFKWRATTISHCSSWFTVKNLFFFYALYVLWITWWLVGM